jgi:hypothetical protein
LGANQISDLAPLSELVNLTELGLSHNQISDLTPLSELANLTMLQLGNNRINDLSPLSELTTLTRLDLWQNQISDLTPLSELANLTILGLRGNQISNLAPLSGLANLTSLALNGNRISDLSPLANLTDLSVLDIGDNHIFDWSPVAHVPNIRGQSEQTGVILSEAEAQERIARWFPDDIITRVPRIDRLEDGVRIFGFILDYSAWFWYTTCTPTYAYAWINSDTRETWFEESGYTKERGRNWYANIANTVIPVPMIDGIIIPYVRFSPPRPGHGITYSRVGMSVELYKEQLRAAGFVLDEYSPHSWWIYEGDSEGSIFWSVTLFNYCADEFSMDIF